MSKENGGPAFPERCDSGFDVAGMTLRDYFAAKALQGMAASDYWGDNLQENKPDWIKPIATVAFQMADEMLKAREQ